MKLVGSKTGAYEYWIELKSGFKLWTGQRTNSDTDILLNKGEKKPDNRYDFFYGDPFGPYVQDNRLVTPSNYDYLMFPLCHKLFFKNMGQALINNYLSVANILDKNQNKVAEIYLDYSKIPMQLCQRISNRAESKMNYYSLVTNIPNEQ